MPIEANPKPCASSIVNVAFDVDIRRATLHLLKETCPVCCPSGLAICCRR